VSYTDATLGAAAETKQIRRIGWTFALFAIPAFALLALAFGKEASWDFQNYHWYDPYALLAGRLGFDIAVAHHATYYNPFLDVPLYWLGSRFPAWVPGLWLGAQAGITAALLGGIAYRVLNFADRRARLMSAVLLALAGLTGGGALTEIGVSENDIGSGLGALAALFLLIVKLDEVVRAGRRDLLVIGLAGVLAGASPGLKLTTIPYAIGLTLAMLAMPGTPVRRITRAFVFGIGVLLGMVIFGGYWFWTMWKFSGNPIFPYFNDQFASPLVGPGSFRDANFLPTTWGKRLLFPFLFTRDSLLVGEWKYRDAHVLLTYVLAPLAGLSALFAKPPGRRLVEPLAARLLLVGWAGTYLAWLFLFAIYRYLIPLEMLSPIVAVAAISLFPLKASLRLALMVVLLGVTALVAERGGDPRLSWKGRYVEVEVPPLADPAHSLILMSETAPLAYMIPSFPPEIPFLRIQGWLIGSKDNQSGFGQAMHERVAEHQGPLYLLYWLREKDQALKSIADYGLALDESGCKPVTSNVSVILDQGYPVQLCPLTRKAS
jgi:hypothetical protein